MSRDTKEGHSDTVFAVDAHGDNLASIGGPKDRTIKIWTASKSWHLPVLLEIIISTHSAIF